MSVVQRLRAVAEFAPEEVLPLLQSALSAQSDRESGERRQPPCADQIVAAIGDHRAPRGRGRLHSETQEREPGLQHDRVPDADEAGGCGVYVR